MAEGYKLSELLASYQQHRLCVIIQEVEYQSYNIHLNIAMRNRKGFDWSRPFRLIDNKKEFDQLDVQDETLIVVQTDPSKPTESNKKEQIPIPLIETVNKATQVKKFAKITPNYIRLPPHLNLPSPYNYQLTQVDHAFVKNHQDRFYFKGKKVLTQEFLKKCITELELKAGKDMTLPRNKGWMTALMEKEFKELLQMDSADQLCETVYNYWKSRRQQIKFPLLRLLWKPNPDEYNHMLAFRPREREKRNLRRTNRVVQDEIIEQLYQEFDMASKIVDRIQMREGLKLNQVSLQLSSFHSECKPFVGLPEYMQGLQLQDRGKEKEKMKTFYNCLENYKNRKIDIQKLAIQQTGENQVDQKQSIINFLSTVVAQAASVGISYETFFTPQVTQSKLDVSTAQTLMSPETKTQSEQYMRFSLQRYDNMLIRAFNQQQDPVNHIEPCKDYLQLKRRKVDTYYFGSDDEEELKDIKKNVTASFKRYQQLQSMSRTFSATSEY